MVDRYLVLERPNDSIGKGLHSMQSRRTAEGEGLGVLKLHDHRRSSDESPDPKTLREYGVVVTVESRYAGVGAD
jgi:hypothetical protein